MKLHASHAALSEGVSTARRTRLPLSQVKPHVAAVISQIGGQAQPSANSSHSREQEQQPKNSRAQFELSCCPSSSCGGAAAAAAPFWDAPGRPATQTSTNSSSVDCRCTSWLAITPKLCAGKVSRRSTGPAALVVVGFLSWRKDNASWLGENCYFGCVLGSNATLQQVYGRNPAVHRALVPTACNHATSMSMYDCPQLPGEPEPATHHDTYNTNSTPALD